ncbi:hypothetical protein AW168_01975 [Nocardia brasiliensis]|nr:hypothetical protein AW168_01975 [Nocardia brasiliensis]
MLGQLISRPPELSVCLGFTVVDDGRVEPDITYDAAAAVRVYVAEMDRIGVPSPEELNSRVHGTGQGPVD